MNISTVLSSLKKQLASVGSEVSGLTRKIEAAKREREELEASVASKDDVFTALCARLDIMAEEQVARVEQAITPFRFSRKVRNLLLPHQEFSWLLKGQNDTAVPGLALLFGDELKAGLKRALDKMAWPTSVDMAARNKRMAELDEAIGQMEAELDGLRRAAGEAGIVI